MATLFGTGDPMKQAVNDLIGKLRLQGLTRAANLIVLAQMTTERRGGNIFVMGFGTAVRVKRTMSCT